MELSYSIVGQKLHKFLIIELKTLEEITMRGRKPKLNSEQMNRIYDGRLTFDAKTLASMYGVSVTTVYNLLNKMSNSEQKMESQIEIDFKGKE